MRTTTVARTSQYITILYNLRISQNIKINHLYNILETVSFWILGSLENPVKYNSQINYILHFADNYIEPNLLEYYK